VEKRDYSCPKGGISYWFIKGLGIVALLRCLFPNREIPFWDCSTFLRGNTSRTIKLRMFNTVSYPRVGPMVGNILNIPDQQCAGCPPRGQQRSDARTDDHYAQHDPTIGETWEVTPSSIRSLYLS